MRIVIVDDELMIVKGLAEMLRSMPESDHQIHATTNPESALSYVMEYRPELLITDIRMAGMSGLELMKSIRSRRLDTAIVVVSGYDNFEFVRAALQFGARDYLLKPINRGELYSIVQRLAWECGQDDAEEAETVTAQEIVPSAKYSDLVQSLIDYIENNCEQGISLTTLSDYSGMNANYICTLFKKEVGVNFLEYMNEVRLRRAKMYLSTRPDMPVQELALKLGYTNERQFFRMFKSKTGMSPNKYRQSIRLEEGK